MAAHDDAAPQQPKQAPGSLLGMVDRLYRGAALVREHATDADREQLAQAALEMESLALVLRGELVRREQSDMARAA